MTEPRTNEEGVEFTTPRDATFPEPTEETVENPARPEAIDPHPVDENPEEHIGDELPDPWHREQDEWADVLDDRAYQLGVNETEQQREDERDV